MPGKTPARSKKKASGKAENAVITRGAQRQNELIQSALAEQGILLFDADDRIQFVNKWVAVLTEVPADLLEPGRPRRDLVEYRARRGDYGDNAEGTINHIMERSSAGASITVESTTPSGRKICANSIPLPDGFYSVTYIDITAVHQCVKEIDHRTSELEEADRRNRALVSNLQAVIESIDYGIVFMDADLNVDLVNRAFRDMWGMDESDIERLPTMRELMEFNRYNGIYDVDDADWDDYVRGREAAVRRGRVPPTEIHRADGKVLSYQCIILQDGCRMLAYFDITDIYGAVQEIEARTRELERLNRENEALVSNLQAVIENIDYSVMFMDEDLNVQMTNRAFREMWNIDEAVLKECRTMRDLLEYNRDRDIYDLGGKSWEDYVRDRQDAVRKGDIPATEMRGPGGKILSFRCIALPDGRRMLTHFDITDIYGAVQEIEARTRELEKVNRENEALVSNLRAVIENIDYGVLFMDADLRPEIVSPAFCEMWGFGDEHAVKRLTLREMMESSHSRGLYDVSEEEWPEYLESRLSRVQSGAVPSMLMHLNNGQVLDYQCIALPDGRRMMTYFDVTEAKQREQQIEDHAAALSVIQNAIGHGLSWFDENLNLRAWNRNFRELLDFPEDKFQLGDPAEKFFRFNAERGEYGEGDTDQQVAERIELAKRFDPHCFERTRADGTILKIEGYPVKEGGFVTVYTDVTEARRSEKQVQYLAHHDALTGLPNRLLFNEHLKRAQAQARADGDFAAVICFDLDNFKDVNDTLGHATGDQLLKAVATRVERELGANEILCRLGGDEFAVIQCNFDDPILPGHLAERIVETVSEPYMIDGQEIVVGASAGISLSAPQDRESDPDTLLRHADLAMYSAKGDGRGTFHFFKSEMKEELRARKDMEADLRQALCEDQFQVFYQPQVDAATRQVIGVEALLRWQHPLRGLVPPAEFIGLSEDTGLIRQIGEFVIKTACAEIAPWRPLKLAINLSPVQFRKNDIVEMVSAAISQTGMAPGRLELEITENVLLLDTEETIETLKRLKSFGCSIVMDDFGAGYSSLSYLRLFPFDKLKIDRNFISDIGHSSESSAIVRSVIGLGKSLGMRANAEGVETHLQADILRLEGCDELQGFYFGRPVPLDELHELLKGPCLPVLGNVEAETKPEDGQTGEGEPATHPCAAVARIG